MDTLQAFAHDLAHAPLPGTHRLAGPKTQAEYLRDVALFATWFAQTTGDDFHPARVTRADLRDYIAFLRSRGRKPATIRRKFAALRAFFAWARLRGDMVDDPTAGIVLPKVQPLAPRGLQTAERRALLRAINRPLRDTPTARLRAVRDRALIILLMEAGPRVSEVVAARLGDLEISPRKGSLRIREGKGDKERRIALPLETRRALQAWLEVRPEVAHDRLFTTARKPFGPLSVRGVQAIVAEAGHRAGLDGLSPHVLRHTAVYAWKAAGIDPFVIAAQFGHESLETTQRYGRPRLTDLHRAAARV